MGEAEDEGGDRWMDGWMDGWMERRTRAMVDGGMGWGED